MRGAIDTATYQKLTYEKNQNLNFAANAEPSATGYVLIPLLFRTKTKVVGCGPRTSVKRLHDNFFAPSLGFELGSRASGPDHSVQTKAKFSYKNSKYLVLFNCYDIKHNTFATCIVKCKLEQSLYKTFIIVTVERGN